MLAIGIDHSLTAFGIVAVPDSWGCDFSRVLRETLTTKPGQPDAIRRAWLARDVVRFVDHAAQEFRVPLSAVRVGIEGGIAMRGKLKTIRSQERLAAIVEDRLFHELGLELVVAAQASVRATFMGRTMAGSRGAGAAAQALLDQLIPRRALWHEAELDAFLVANFLLAESGEAFVSVAPSERRERVHR